MKNLADLAVLADKCPTMQFTITWFCENVKARLKNEYSQEAAAAVRLGQLQLAGFSRNRICNNYKNVLEQCHEISAFVKLTYPGS